MLKIISFKNCQSQERESKPFNHIKITFVLFFGFVISFATESSQLTHKKTFVTNTVYIFKGRKNLVGCYVFPFRFL